MARANQPYIMDAFGHLFYRPRRQRRKRCVICNELTHSSLWKTYWLPKSEKYIDGIHCELCTPKQDKLWKEEVEWDNKQIMESKEPDA